MTRSSMAVRWRKYRTARSLLREHMKPAAAHFDCRPEEVGMGEWTFDDFVDKIEKHGKWAYVDTHAEPPVVHYWHRADVPIEKLAYMLGHELGHVSGKPFKDAHKEEHRADEYGAVAAAVVRKLLGK